MTQKQTESYWNLPAQTLHVGIYSTLCAFVAEALLHYRVGTTATFLTSVGRLVLVMMASYLIHRFAEQSLPSYQPNRKDLLFTLLAMLGSFVILLFGNIMSLGVATYLEKIQFARGFELESLTYAVPFAAGGLVVQSVLGLHFGMVFSLTLALVAGIYIPGSPIVAPYVFITSLVACLSLQKFRNRFAYARAGFNVTLIAALFSLCEAFISGGITPSDLFIRLLCALLSGLLSAFLAAGITPIVEYVFGYVTDMRLLEMATLDHPLLKELSIAAPGTWNHSMVMGMMVEAAADAIGANPVLARVGAYFHDIGKSKKPLYFIENQGDGENRHDKLSPSMSALIIRSHVKDGIDLAKKHKLPKLIEDMIPQHHGVSLIEYFYDKACKEAKDSGLGEETVDRSLYTYPGPRPQTREAGILMLADGIEAATRTLAEPSPDRIQGLVQKMINKVFASGELEECELTLKDLHLIAKCFTRVLTGIHHQRIAYAEPAEKTSDRSESEEPARVAFDEQGNGKNEDKAGRKSTKEDLKRLGI